MFHKPRRSAGTPDPGAGRPLGRRLLRRRRRRALRRRAPSADSAFETGGPLAGLEDTVVENIGTGPGTFEHVIVGPRGVYLIDSRRLSGVTEIRDGGPVLHGEDATPGARAPIETLRRRVLADAASVSAALRRHTGRSTWVTAVVVLWSEFPQGAVETDRVVYVHGSRFGAWLAARPACLDAAAVAEIGAALTALRRDRDVRFPPQRTDGGPRARPSARAAGAGRPGTAH